MKERRSATRPGADAPAGGSSVCSSPLRVSQLSVPPPSTVSAFRSCLPAGKRVPPRRAVCLVDAAGVCHGDEVDGAAVDGDGTSLAVGGVGCEPVLNAVDVVGDGA